jgi:hypothetical protein
MPKFVFFHRPFVRGLFPCLQLQADTQHYALCKKFLVKTILTKGRFYIRIQKEMWWEFRNFCLSIRKLSTTSDIWPRKITWLSYGYSHDNITGVIWTLIHEMSYINNRTTKTHHCTSWKTDFHLSYLIQCCCVLKNVCINIHPLSYSTNARWLHSFPYLICLWILAEGQYCIRWM